MSIDELTVEMYKNIKPEDVLEASEKGELLSYFGGIVRKIFPKTTMDWKKKKTEERKTPEEDSVRIGVH